MSLDRLLAAAQELELHMPHAADGARSEPSKGKRLLNLLKGKDRGDAEPMEPAAAMVRPASMQ